MLPFFTRTARDSYRPDSQDRVAVAEVPGGVLLIAVDGAGGRSGAAEAADQVVAGALELLPLARTPADPHPWSLILAEIDQRLSESDHGGEAAVVLVAVTEEGVAGASAGDCEAWVLGDGAVDRLTEGQRRKPFVGTGAACPVGFHRPTLAGTLLVGTDGLFGAVPEEAVLRAVLGADLESAAASLLGLARGASGQPWDDVGLVLCRRAA